MKKIAILGSGSGSNMQAIADAISAGKINAEIVYVGCDIEGAFLFQRAKNLGLECELIDCLGYKQKFPAEVQSALAEKLKEMGVDLICLAGFMRLVGQPLLQVFPDRILNIHPSLLPAYPGLHAWEQAVDDGATKSGCTVHYVDAGMDTGEIIAQATVPVLPGDTAKTLHERIQIEERKLYPLVVAEVLSKLG